MKNEIESLKSSHTHIQNETPKQHRNEVLKPVKMSVIISPLQEKGETNRKKSLTD